MIRIASRREYWTSLRKILLIFICLTSSNCTSRLISKRINTIDVGLQNNSPLYLLGCSVLDRHFNFLRQLPGDGICLPFADGSWVSSDGQKLVSWAHDGEVVWTLPGHFHHQIRTDDEGNILLLGSDIVLFKQYKIRMDTIEIHDRSGNLLFSWHLKDHLNEIQKFSHLPKSASLFWGHPDYPADKSVTFEFSHINSISAIPKESRAKLNGAIYLIYDPILNISLGLDRKLENVVWGAPLPDGGRPDPLKHDVQFTKNVELLYFDNYGFSTNVLHSNKIAPTANDSTDACESYAVFLRSIEGTVIFQFPKNTQECLPTYSKGSVEIIDDTFLINVPSGKNSFVGLLDRAGNWIQRKSVDAEYQEIKLLPYQDFLEKNQVH